MLFLPSSLPCWSLFSSTLFNSLVLSYLLYSVDSFPFSSILCLCTSSFLLQQPDVSIVIVGKGAVVTKSNLELILFILVLILRALSSLFFSTLLVFILPNSFQSLVLSHLLYSVDSSPLISLPGLCNCFLSRISPMCP